MNTKRYRAGVIGSTGKGGYGHGMESVFRDMPSVEFVAIADDDPPGRKSTAMAAGVDKTYADFREMLSRERLDIIGVGPSWLDRRVDMIAAAVDAGCHIYCEKPLAWCLTDADQIIAACDKARLKLAVAHLYRGMAPVYEAQRRLSRGDYGQLIRMRARPKDDSRGGGEELLIHGTHWLDLMVQFAGPPRWVSGHMSVGGRDVTRADQTRGTGEFGPLASDSFTASFGFDNGVRGFFDSTVGLARPDQSCYGLLLECSEAMVFVRNRGEVFVYPANTTVPEADVLKWERLWVENWHFNPDHTPRPSTDFQVLANKSLVIDLIGAIEKDRRPLADGEGARLAVEMIQGVYASHFADGKRLAIPLTDRRHPLEG